MKSVRPQRVQVMTHIDYMKRARELAERGRGKTSPNPMVGCVIVRGERIIAEGWHARCGGPHAEIAALAKAGARASGARMYVTLEPCAHFGRTPPCVDDIIAHGLREVHIGTRDPNPLTRGKSVRALGRAGIKVSVGLLSRELLKLNEAFFKMMNTGLPFTTAKIAASLDGKIATSTGQSEWITSSTSRRHAHLRRREFDGILVGVNTVLKDNPGLESVPPSPRLVKIVVDSSLKTPERAKLFQGTNTSRVIIATTRRAPAKKIKRLSKLAQVWICPVKAGRVDLQWLWRALGKHGLSNLLIEGGGEIISGALKEKLVDKIHYYLAPKIFGDEQALSAVRGFRLTQVDEALKLGDAQLTPLGRDIFYEGYVQYVRR